MGNGKMKKVLGMVSLLALFAIPVIGHAQVGQTRNITFGGFSPTTNIPTNVVEQVLTMAAPFFEMTPAELINLHNQTTLVTVTQVGPNVYFVSYGGIGIQIVVDGARLAGQIGGLSTVPGPKR